MLTYAAFAPVWLRLAEGSAGISEAELAGIWQQQRYPAGALQLAGGGTLEVIFPGRRNDGPGPDFRDACIRLDGEIRLGDVELHLRSSGFRSHGHHLDPAYDALVLHVVHEADEGVSRLHSGGAVPVASFSRWLRQRSEELQGWLAGPVRFAEPCATARQRLSPEDIETVIDDAAERRWQRLVQRRRSEAQTLGAEQALWLAVLEALAYGGDRAGFRRLGELVPAGECRLLAAAGELETTLLTVAGLRQTDAGGPRLSPGLDWPPCRPANRPQRRLTAAARLWQGASHGLLARAEASVWQAASAARLPQLWMVTAETGPAWLGAERATEVLLNAVLPCLSAVSASGARAADLARQLRATAAYGKTAFLEKALQGAAGRRPLKRAWQQQGLLELYGSWCSRGGCGRCPLS